MHHNFKIACAGSRRIWFSKNFWYLAYNSVAAACRRICILVHLRIEHFQFGAFPDAESVSAPVKPLFLK